MSTPATEGRVPVDSLPHRLIVVRHELGWTQREAAERCGLTFGEWQSMENGRRARGLDEKVRRIAAATGYNPVWLMWGGPLSRPQGPNSPTPGGTTPPKVTRPKVFAAARGGKARLARKSASVRSITPLAA